MNAQEAKKMIKEKTHFETAREFAAAIDYLPPALELPTFSDVSVLTQLSANLVLLDDLHGRVQFMLREVSRIVCRSAE